MKKRGCGFRKVGGLYLVGDSEGFGCHRLPIPIDEPCPVCGEGIRFFRGMRGISPRKLIGICPDWKKQVISYYNPDGKLIGVNDALEMMKCTCPVYCPACNPPDSGFLMWVGNENYSPESFISEAKEMGISKRIRHIPDGFKLGESWVYLAHIKGYDAQGKPCPGIFSVFKPHRIEKIILEKDFSETVNQDCLDKGITPVLVPNDYEKQIEKLEKKESKPDRAYLRESCEKSHLCPECGKCYLEFSEKQKKAICPGCLAKFKTFKELFKITAIKMGWGHDAWDRWLEGNPEYKPIKGA